MVEIAPKIFKKYEIRGSAEGKDTLITPEVARLVGHAFGTYAQRVDDKKMMVIGRG
jgi:phosphomannomutase